MAVLPSISGQDALKVFGKFGYVFHRQSGSHIIVYHPQTKRHLSIPDHDELAKGTLRALIRASGITVEDFVDMLRG